MEPLCPPAAPSINEFGANVEAAQMIDEDIENYQHKIRALKTRRNTLVLISKLPPELLSTIFQVVQSEYYFPRQRKWTTVSRVCGHWRRVALQSPSLWNHIDINGYGSGAWVEMFLERSKRVALTLSAELANRSLQPVSAALENIERTRRLSLYALIPMAQNLLDIMETRPAPLLEYLHITSAKSIGESRLPERLFAGNLPSLRVLKLIDCHFSGNGYSPSILQLISILKTSPSLEQLDLDGLFPESQPGTGIGSPIPLPNLSVISVRSSISSCVKILNHISYPATSPVSIGSHDTRRKLEDIFGITYLMFNPENIVGVRPPIRYLRVTSSCGSSLNVTAWCRPGSSPEEPSEGPKFNLNVHMLSDVSDPSADEDRDTFWSILPLQGLDCLEVSGLDLRKPAWLQLSGHLEQLTALRLGMLTDKVATSVLGALSVERPGVQRKDREYRQNIAHLHFPALRELSIMSWDFKTPPEGQKQTSKLLEHLIVCLKTRKKLGAGIETLNIGCCRYLYSSGVDELKKVVPQVIWDMSERGRPPRYHVRISC